MIFLLDIAEFKRGKDKKKRIRKTKYGPAGMSGMKYSTRLKNMLGYGLGGGLTAGTIITALSGGKKPPLKTIGKYLGIGAGIGATGATAAHLNSVRSPIKSIREKRQKEAYAQAARLNR